MWPPSFDDLYGSIPTPSKKRTTSWARDGRSLVRVGYPTRYLVKSWLPTGSSSSRGQNGQRSERVFRSRTSSEGQVLVEPGLGAVSDCGQRNCSSWAGSGKAAFISLSGLSGQRLLTESQAGALENGLEKPLLA